MQSLPEILEPHKNYVLNEAYYFPKLTNSFYHNSPGVSSSTIRKFMDSQVHALYEEIEDTPALRFGTAAHALIVEGQEAFDKDIAVIVGSPYTSANKSLKADYEQRGYTVINNQQKEDIFAMEEALIPEASKYLNPNELDYPSIFESPYESSFYWYEGETLCKLRSDVIRHPIGQPYSEKNIIIVDYKTTMDCSPKGFTSSVRKYGYDLQASWYKRGYEKAGFKVEGFYFVAQEKKKPYASKIFKMSEKDLVAGWIALEGTLGLYRDVMKGEEPMIHNSPNLVEIKLREDSNANI